MHVALRVAHQVCHSPVSPGCLCLMDVCMVVLQRCHQVPRFSHFLQNPALNGQGAIQLTKALGYELLLVCVCRAGHLVVVTCPVRHPFFKSVRLEGHQASLYINTQI